MSEITLGDYLGYIFLEIIKAREAADRYSREVAERYRADPVMQYFSVPRFKVPKMDLTIPVLVSGARFTQTVKFNLTETEFVAELNGRLTNVLRTVYAANPKVLDSLERGLERGREVVKVLGGRLFHEVSDDVDPLRPDGIVRYLWPQIFMEYLSAVGAHGPDIESARQLLDATTDDVLGLVVRHMVIDSQSIENLLINPETNVVKTGSSDATVFTIRAEMLEEGFFIHAATDVETGVTRDIVEFE